MSIRFFQNFRRKKKMKDFRIEKLANNLLTYSVNIQKGDNILIEVLGEEGINLAKELLKYSSNFNLYVVPITKLQEEIYQKIDTIILHMPDYIKDFVQDREDKDQSPRTTLEYLKNYKLFYECSTPKCK